jgi:hypothetical protein
MHDFINNGSNFMERNSQNNKNKNTETTRFFDWSSATTNSDPVDGRQFGAPFDPPTYRGRISTFPKQSFKTVHKLQIQN